MCKDYNSLTVLPIVCEGASLTQVPQGFFLISSSGYIGGV